MSDRRYNPDTNNWEAKAAPTAAQAAYWSGSGSSWSPFAGYSPSANGGTGGFGGTTALSNPFSSSGVWGNPMGGNNAIGGIGGPLDQQQPEMGNPLLDINAAAQPLDILAPDAPQAPMDGQPQTQQQQSERPQNLFEDIANGAQELFSVSDDPQERQQSSTGMGGFADMMAPIWRLTSPKFNQMERQAQAQQVELQRQETRLETERQQAAVKQAEAQREAAMMQLAQRGRQGDIGAINQLRDNFPEQFNEKVLPALATQMQDNAQPLSRLATQINMASTPQDFENIRQDARVAAPEIGRLIGGMTDQQLKQSQPMLQQVANAATTLNLEQERVRRQQDGYTPVVDSKGAPAMQTIVSPAGGEFEVPLEKNAFGETRPDIDKLRNPNFILASGSQVDALSKEYSQQRAAFVELDQLYENVMDNLENWDGNESVISTATINYLNRALDPNSAVQMGETRMFLAQRGLLQSFQGAIQNLTVGGNLTPEIVASVADQVARIRDNSMAEFDTARSSLIEKGANYRINPATVFQGWNTDAQATRRNAQGEVLPTDAELWEAAKGRANDNINALIASYGGEILARENQQSGGGSAIPPSAPPPAAGPGQGAASPLAAPQQVPPAGGGTPPMQPPAAEQAQVPPAPPALPDAPGFAPGAPQQAQVPPAPPALPDAPGFAPGAPPPVAPANPDRQTATVRATSLPLEQMAGNTRMPDEGFNRLSQELGSGTPPPQIQTPQEYLAAREQPSQPGAGAPMPAPRIDRGPDTSAPRVPPEMAPPPQATRPEAVVPPTPTNRPDAGGNIVPPIPRPVSARPVTPEQEQGIEPIQGGRLNFDLDGKIRSRPISTEYQQAVTAITESVMERMDIGDIQMRVTSGGQMPIAEARRLGARENSKGEWILPNGRKVRTGSVRHDTDETGTANTADIVLQVNGKDVTPLQNPGLYEQFIEEAAASGFSGVGVYSWGMHIGGGNKAAWGDQRFKNAATRGWNRSTAPADGSNPQVPMGAGGITPQYINNLAFIESSNRNLPSRGGGTVSGFFQFTDATWKEVTGLPGSAVDYSYEEQANAAMKFTRTNAQGLSSAGIPPNSENLYTAHFLGLAGAKRFIPAPDDELATRYVSRRAAENNRAIFFGNGREPRTVGEVRAILASKGNGNNGAPPTPPVPRPPFNRNPQTSTPPPTAPMGMPDAPAPPPTGQVGVDPAAVRTQAMAPPAAPTGMPDAPGFSPPAPPPAGPPPVAPDGTRQPAAPGSDFLLNQNQAQVYDERPENQVRADDAGRFQAFATGVAQGATLNFADELGIINREEYNALREQFPVTTTISEMIGGAATGGTLAGAAARGLAKLTAGMSGALAPRIVQGVGNTAVFAGEGAVTGAGMGTDADSRMSGALAGASAGIAIGGTLALIGNQLSRVVGNMGGERGTSPAVMDIMRRAAAGDEAALQQIRDTGATEDVIASGLDEFRAYERMQKSLDGFESELPEGALTREARVQDATGVTGDRSTFNLGTSITEALQQRVAQQKQVADEAYASLERILPDYPMAEPSMFLARVIDRAEGNGFVALKGPDPVNPSISLLEANMDEMFDTNGVVNFDVFSRVRSALGSNATALRNAGNEAPARQLQILQTAMDKEFEEALSGQFMGTYVNPSNPDVPAALKDARSKWREYLETRGRGDQSTVQNVVRQFVDQNKTPEEAVNYLLGSTLVGDNNVARAALIELQNIAGKDGPIMQSIKSVAVGRIFRDKFGELLPDDRMAQGMAFYVDGEGKDIGRILFEPNVIDTFRVLSGALRGDGGSVAKQEARRTIGNISRGIIAGTAGHGLAQGSAFISAYGSGKNSIMALFNKVDQNNYPMQFLQQNLTERRFTESAIPQIVGGAVTTGAASGASIVPSISGIGGDPMELYQQRQQQRQQQQQNSLVQR